MNGLRATLQETVRDFIGFKANPDLIIKKHNNEFHLDATTSISTSAPKGRAETAIAVLAGYGSSKKSP